MDSLRIQPGAISVRQATQWLHGITYKPGWRFTAHSRWIGPEQAVIPEFARPAAVEVGVTVEDTYHPGRTIPLSIRKNVPNGITERGFYDWLLGIILWIEDHEAREWFKHEGRPHRDPHNIPYTGDVPDQTLREYATMSPYTNRAGLVRFSYEGGGGGGAAIR